MNKPTGYPWHLPHRTVPLNVTRYLFSCIFDPEVPRFFLFLLFTAKTEVAPVSLPTGIKQVWRGNYGHEPSGFPGSFVRLREIGLCLVLHHCTPEGASAANYPLHRSRQHSTVQAGSEQLEYSKHIVAGDYSKHCATAPYQT